MTAQKPVAASPKGPLLKRLSVRLMLAMGVALLPLALLTYIQTVETEEVAEGRARAAILGDTVIAAGPQIDVILRARAITSALATAMPVLLKDNQSCINILTDLKAEVGDSISLIAFTGMDKIIECASTGRRYDMSGVPDIDAWFAPDEPHIRVNPNGPISNQSILGVAHPVFDAAGTKLGIITISVPHGELNPLDVGSARSAVDEQPLSLVTFNVNGDVLTATGGLDRSPGYLPAAQPLASFVGTTGQSFLGTTQSGERRAFAVVPLIPDTLYVLGSWPANRLDSRLLRFDVPPFVFPLLMWAASLMVAWLAAEQQVIRHVKSLRNSIVAFAGGNRKLLPVGLAGAATELADVGEAYDKMTEAVLHDEAEMEDMLHQKEVLMREVHHRVKNNLQLIASILNMQLRSAQSPETKEAMRTVQERVLSLATVHRELYQTSGLVDVRADELLPQIISHILKLGSAPGRRYSIDRKIDDIRLTPDQAVPLSLFLTEGMANVLKHAPREGKTPTRIKLRLVDSSDGFAHFTLSNPVEMVATGRDGAPITLITSDGFGSQLLVAFARQLDGKLERTQDNGMYRLTLRFPLRALSSAEERVSPTGPDEDAPTDDSQGGQG